MSVYRFLYAAARIRKYFAPAVKKLFPEKLTGPAALSMLLPDLSAVPPIRIPPGYYSASLSPGHEIDYARVMSRSLVAEADANWFSRTFNDDPAYNPDNLLLIYEDTTPVAAAAAWQKPSEAKKTGLVYMLGVDRDYQGRGLGRIMLLLVLHRLKDRGFHKVLAITEDFRLPVISLYLSLGFKPQYRNRLDALRWKKALRRVRGMSKKRPGS
jgi:ribosomal protein S18 acetylase RimI-like enzyme